MENKNKLDLINSAKSINELFENDSQNAINLMENNWIKDFCLSEISNSDKTDVLILSKSIFNKYNKHNKTSNNKFEVFINLINSKKYIQAVKLSKLLALRYHESKQKVIDIIKNKQINIVFFDLDMEPGGVGSTIINRSNNLTKKGYKINLLSTDNIKNYPVIKKHFHNTKNLSEDVNIINIYEYYLNKNSLNHESKKSEIDKNPKYIINKIKNPDNSITYEYSLKDNIAEKVKKELFIDGSLIYKQSFSPKKREYFTPDGFNYFTYDGKYTLKDRLTDTHLEFKTINQFLAHFINEYCDLTENKPFLICDNHMQVFNINHVDTDLTMKIASIHGNPYYKRLKADIGEDREINPKIPMFKILNQLDAFVVLTDSMKTDLEKEFNFNKFITIPNFISDNKLNYPKTEKDFNRISMFTRLSTTKNVADAIKAFKIVSEKNDDAVLEIYGRIEGYEKEKNKLSNLAKELSIENRVIFKGFTDNTDIEMQKSLCTLMTSYSEGFSMTLIESMANSTPVITYDTNYGPRDAITNNVDGYVVDFGDYKAMAECILELLNNNQKAIDMGLKAKEKVKNKFSASVVTDMWEDLLVHVYAEDIIKEYENTFKKNNNKSKDIEKLKKENKKLKSQINQKSDGWKIKNPFKRKK